jgi:hypothetical protein
MVACFCRTDLSDYGRRLISLLQMDRYLYDELMAIPTFVLYILPQRLVISGLAARAVKD